MKIKRFIYLIALVLLISLSACSGTGDQATSTGQPPAESGQSKVPTASNQDSGVSSDEIDKENKDPFEVTLAGGSVGGFWAGLGQVISKAFATSYPGSAATYEPGSGVGNIKLIDENQVELGLVQSVEVVAALNGWEPFPKKYEGLMALATIYDNAVLQVIVRKDFADRHQVNSLADVAAKKIPAKIAINQLGNMNSAAAYSVLESYGITEESLKQWGGSLTWVGSQARFEAIQNGRADISLDYVFAPDAKVQETAINTPLVIWSIDDNAISAVNEKWQLEKTVIPKGTYDWQDEDVTTLALSALILTSNKISKQDHYKMAKALVDNLDILNSFHPAMKEISAEKMANTGSIPLAPGAEQFFKEIGALK